MSEPRRFLKSRPPQPVSTRGALVLATGLALLATQPAHGTPLTLEGEKGTLTWPDNSTITVYVPEDPEDKVNEEEFKKGVLAWNSSQTLKDKGITIEVKDGTPPEDAKNAVTVSWKDKITNNDGKEFGGFGGPEVDAKNNTVSGFIDVARDFAEDDQMAKNLGTHEMGHVLGLDDVSEDGAAMNPDFTKDDTVTITDKDEKEIKATYKATKADGQASIDVLVTPDSDGWRYDYQLSWMSGEALAVFQVDADLDSIFDLVYPSGWEIDDFSYLDGEIIADPSYPPEEFVSFILRDETAYFGPDNPSLVFSLFSTHPPLLGEAFLYGRSMTLAPVAIALPAAFPLMAAALGGLAFVRRREARTV